MGGGGEPDFNHINQVFCNLAENTAESLMETNTHTTALTCSQEPARLDNEQLSVFTETTVRLAWSENL